MSDDVRTAIASIADRTHGFRASYIAETTGRGLRDVQRELVEMVDRGELALEYQLVCPDDGAILKRFKQDQPLPIGEEIDADDCEPFVAEKRHFLVAYRPEAPLLQSILGRERSGKARARPGGTRRRADRALGMIWPKRPI